MSDWYTHEAYQDLPEDQNRGNNGKGEKDKRGIVIYLIFLTVALVITYFTGFGIYCDVTHQEAEQGKRACQEIEGQNIPLVFLTPEEVSLVETCERFGTLTGRFVSYNEFLCPWLD